MHQKTHIRFITSDYKTLFYIPDGGRIRITYPDGRQLDRVYTASGRYFFTRNREKGR